MPCWELFDEQDQEYQESVLLSNHQDVLRIYVEKAATKNTGHDKYAHYSVLMPSFGLSGKAADVEKKLEFTPEYIAAKVWASWMDRGRILPQAGDEPDHGPSTWVSQCTDAPGHTEVDVHCSFVGPYRSSRALFLFRYHDAECHMCTAAHRRTEKLLMWTCSCPTGLVRSDRNL